jgi:hypothetical protein
MPLSSRLTGLRAWLEASFSIPQSRIARHRTRRATARPAVECLEDRTAPALLVNTTLLGGSGNDNAIADAVDSPGNIYITGTTGSSSFPGTSQTNPSGSGFLSKLDSSGRLLWSTLYGPGGGSAIALDSSGNVYIPGWYDGLVFKFNSSGALVWSADIGAETGGYFVSAAVDWVGDVCVVGTATTTGFPNGDVLVAKLDSSGNLLWSRDLGGNGPLGAVALAVVVDSSNNFFVSGGESAPTFPGTTQTNTTGGNVGFVSKLDSSGTLQWSTLSGGGFGIALDSSGNIYSTGFTTCKLDPSGKLLWSNNLAGTDLALDSAGNTYLAGGVGGGSTTLPGTSQTGSKNANYVGLAKLNASGELVWLYLVGGSGDDSLSSGGALGGYLAMDSSGNFYIAGGTSSTDFPGASQPLAGSSDAFVTKLQVLDTPSAILSSLQSALATNSSVTLLANSSADAQAVVAAVNSLAPSSTPETVTLDLIGGTWGDLQATPPAGVTLIITGDGTATTIVGQAPVLTVSEGNALVRGVTFTTAANGPTVLVTGGNLTLRSDVVQSSGGCCDAAIAVTGGTLDLGTTAGSGNNIINMNVTGQLVQNTTANAISAVGNTYEHGGVVLTSSTLSFTTLTSSLNFSTLNQPVTLTAQVRANGSSGTPTGSVDFFDTTANNDLGSVTLSGVTASLTTSALAAGNHVIQARYSGDATFLPSLDCVTQSVQYNFIGFLPPLHKSIAFGLNRTIPIKWQLRDFNGTLITGLSAVTSLQVAPVLSGGGLGTPFNPTASGSTGLRNDGSQYIFNWQTKGLTAGTYEILLTLADGTVQTKIIQLNANGSGGALLVGGTSGATTAVGALLGGDIDLYVDNTNGNLTADELARIQDAVTAVDTVTEPYGVTIQEVTDPTLADVTLNMDSTSAVGGYADGVLGCTTDAGQITIIAGWNFYTGSDATQIGSAQYDFLTVVTHELGHALGLGHSTDSTSVMYATLNIGTVNRSLTTADLNIPDSVTTGACGLHAVRLSALGSEGSVGAGSSAAPSDRQQVSGLATSPVAAVGPAGVLINGPRVERPDGYLVWTQETGSAAALSPWYGSSRVIGTFPSPARAFASQPAGLFRAAVALSGSGAADSPQGPDENPSGPPDGSLPVVPAANPVLSEQAIDVLLARVDPAQEPRLPIAGMRLTSAVESIFAADAVANPPPVQLAVNGPRLGAAESAAVDADWAWAAVLGLLLNTQVQGHWDWRLRGRIPLTS